MEAVLNCPKCGAEMTERRYGEIAVEQCADCQGAFLGPDDLGHLIDTATAGRDGRARSGSYEGRHRRE